MEYMPELYQTFWALLPPIIAIALALITKEVYSSLFIGIIIGGLLYGNVFTGGFSFETSMNQIFDNGILKVLTDKDNIGILVFLVLLGVMVAMMNKAGGSVAFGRWASKHIKTKVGAQLATVFLGLLIFIDDYFNCLTVGSVMKPVTDSHKVSRAKLAYLIDATAAPICIIAPISSWAAAVSSYVDGSDGFVIFIKAIPYNFYAIFTVITLIAMIVMKVEFGTMKKYHERLAAGEFTEDDNDESTDEEVKGKVVDLIFPVVCLILCCTIGMLYTGGFFNGVDFITAFSECSASYGLMLGSFFALIITFAFYLIRRTIKFSKLCECIPEGFKAMVPAIIILTFAWTLKGMTESLGAKEYVAELIKNIPSVLVQFIPVVVFVVAIFLAFATGTSWGTFGILIPIVVSALSSDSKLMIISISACMAGAVCGDHCSPISDTTIMASAGARCKHIDHVSTQLPYVVMVAVVSTLSYVIACLVKNPVLPIVFGVVVIILFLYFIKRRNSNKSDNVGE